MTESPTPKSQPVVVSAYAANLSDSDLLAPIGAAPVLAMSSGVGTRAPNVVRVPSLDDTRAAVARVSAAKTLEDLPPRTDCVGGVPLTETVTPRLRANGTRLSDQLRQAVDGNIHSAADLEYALRVFASHALRSLALDRHRDLASQARAAAAQVNTDRQDAIRQAVLGEVAAIKARRRLTSGEFQYLLELIDADRCTMAQNLVGPDVDVAALAAGRGTDWRTLCADWADVCTTRGVVTFDADRDAAGSVSYLIEVRPGEGWTLCLFVDQAWIPVEASDLGKARALADRQHVMACRAEAAKPAPALRKVFPDALAGLV